MAALFLLLVPVVAVTSYLLSNIVRAVPESNDDFMHY